MENQLNPTTPEILIGRRTFMQGLAGATIVGGVSAMATPVAAGDWEPQFIQGSVTPKEINLQADSVITIFAGDYEPDLIFDGDFQPDWLVGEALVAGPRFGSKQSLGVDPQTKDPQQLSGDIQEALASNRGAAPYSMRQLGNDAVEVKVRTGETGAEPGDDYGLLIWRFEDSDTSQIREAIVVDSGVEYIDPSQ